MATANYREQLARSADAQRKSELAKIHIHKQQLGMDEAAYRDLLAAVCGVKSSSDLDARGRRKLLDHLGACLKVSGINPNPKRLPTAHNSLALSKEAIEAKIAVQLKNLGQGWPYAYGVARRIFPEVSRFEFLSAAQLGKISSALDRTLRFKGKAPHA